jgi:putative peptidoglycan lipid II flippase
MFKKNSLLINSYITGFAILCSRAIGYVREVLIATWMGTNAATDAFTLITKIPSFLRRITTEGSLSSVLIPILSKLDKENKKSSIQPLIGKIIFMLFIIYFFVMFVSIFFPKAYLKILAPGIFNMPETSAWVMKFNICITGSIIFYFLSGLFGAVLNFRNKFFWPAMAPGIFNITIVILIFWAIAYELDIALIAQFFLISAFMQMLTCLIPYLALRIGFSIKSRNKEDEKTSKEFFTKFGPVVFTTSVSQLTSLISIILSSFLPAGNTTLIHRAERFFQLPLSVISALCTALLPELSQEGDRKKVRTRRLSILVTAAIFIPFSVVFFLFSKTMISFVFSISKCTECEIVQMSNILKLYALGIPSFLLNRVLQLFFFAESSIKIPTRAALINTAFDILISIALINSLASYGLIIAQIVSSWINTFILVYFVIKFKYLKHTTV